MDLSQYDLILINTSGGKDSQAMLGQVVVQATAAGIRDRLVAVHADLGAMEWPGTRAVIQAQVDHYGVPLEVVSRPQGDLLTQVAQRGMWPSSAARYCTSDHKRGQVAKVITRLAGGLARANGEKVRVLNCLGLRAQESPARAKLVPFKRDDRLSNGKRHVDVWLPIHDWTVDQVWTFNRSEGTPIHPAYGLGMPRLSCVFCIFSPKAGLVLAGKHNPELLDRYVAVEQQIGHLFRQDCSIASVRDAVRAGGELLPVLDWKM